MRTDVILLGKNHYEMEGNRGASVVVYGDHVENNNRSGVSISNASIDYSNHDKLNIFPGTYTADISFVDVKSSAGKLVTSLKLSNVVFKERLKFVADKI